MKFLACSLVVILGACTALPDVLYPPQKHLGRVVGGQNAKPGDAPFQISLQSRSGQHICGGCIIGERWIVTAGHCVNGKKPENIKILTGTQKLNSGGKYYYADLIVPHSNYNSPNFHNDIAVIRLNSSISYNSVTKAIKYSYKELPADAVLTLTGWGRLSSGGSLPNDLQTLNLTYISYQECKKLHNNSSSVDYGHVCTYNRKGQGACHGDSGGPLIYKGKLVALVNWGRPCALGYPDAHARISYYHDFIRTTIYSNL